MTENDKLKKRIEELNKQLDDDLYRREFVENIENHPYALQLLQALQPTEAKAAELLADALERAASVAHSKDWGAETAVQWKAGHAIAVELLRAISTGHDLAHIVEKWVKAAASDSDITAESRSERNGNMPRFCWHPLANL